MMEQQLLQTNTNDHKTRGWELTWTVNVVDLLWTGSSTIMYQKLIPPGQLVKLSYRKTEVDILSKCSSKAFSEKKKTYQFKNPAAGSQIFPR